MKKKMSNGWKELQMNPRSSNGYSSTDLFKLLHIREKEKNKKEDSKPKCNDPTSRTPARDPEVHVATHGSVDPEGSQHSLSLLLTTHGATAALATRPTPSSRDDEPQAEGSRGVQELTILALTAADNTRCHSHLRNPSDTELPR
ncbi:hypothetical protein Taro_053278 [Colocasia esculenta]|uniref:Uncharacterized protein n=1 Tax=Colocasia esculenta TaxID=4460 RepID=A0A843XM65_COLES|nr:hypothetical protein [Colocasia esculenta]